MFASLHCQLFSLKRCPTTCGSWPYFEHPDIILYVFRPKQQHICWPNAVHGEGAGSEYGENRDYSLPSGKFYLFLACVPGLPILHSVRVSFYKSFEIGHLDLPCYGSFLCHGVKVCLVSLGKAVPCHSYPTFISSCCGCCFWQVTEVGGVKFWCYNAGHVLGAAMFMLEIAGVKVSSSLSGYSDCQCCSVVKTTAV